MNKKLVRLAVALLIYTCFAIYLYAPYFRHFTKFQYLITTNVCLAALGCYILSYRWIPGFWAQVFAGVIYGFGPFVLSLSKFHPTVGLLAASIPWFFCPVAIFCKSAKQWRSAVFLILPFVAILLFFYLSSHCRFFAIPIWTRLHVSDLAGLLAPLAVVKQGLPIVGFYHVAIAPLIIGFSMLFAARRYSIMIILAIGLALAFCNPVLNISPIIWLTIPVLGLNAMAPWMFAVSPLMMVRWNVSASSAKARPGKPGSQTTMRL